MSVILTKLIELQKTLAYQKIGAKTTNKGDVNKLDPEQIAKMVDDAIKLIGQCYYIINVIKVTFKDLKWYDAWKFYLAIKKITALIKEWEMSDS